MAQLQAFLNRIDFLDDSKAHVYIVVTDGQQKAEADFITSSLADLIGQARRILASIEQAEDLKALQVGQAIDLSQPTPPDPTPLQLFLASYAQLQSALRKVQAGVIAADDADLVALLAATKKLYVSDCLGQG